MSFLQTLLFGHSFKLIKLSYLGIQPYHKVKLEAVRELLVIYDFHRLDSLTKSDKELHLFSLE